MEIRKIFLLIFCVVFSFHSCRQGNAKTKQQTQQQQELNIQAEEESQTKKILPKPKFCEKMESLGLIEIQSIEPNIRVFLPYGTTENFTEQELYDTYQYAYFQPDVAKMLQKAYQFLLQEDSTYTFLIWDAARPLSVQEIMWQYACKMNKKIYVSNPKKTGLHNYGAAVDLTIIDQYGNPLDMGTGFDYFGELAHPQKEQNLLAKGQLTNQQVKNRQLLRRVMQKAGFKVLPTEWWHFNACSRTEAKQKYRIID